MVTPTVGGIVHYVYQSDCHLPAIVVAIRGGGRVDLTIFDRMPGKVMGRRDVPYDEEASALSWHYPEQVDDGKGGGS